MASMEIKSETKLKKEKKMKEEVIYEYINIVFRDSIPNSEDFLFEMKFKNCTVDEKTGTILINSLDSGEFTSFSESDIFMIQCKPSDTEIMS